MKKEMVRNPYNYDSDEVSTLTGLECKDESLTSQEFLQESDINYIAEKFIRTGEAPQVLNLPTSGDFTGIFDFQSAMNLIVQAKQEFMALPAKTRTRFNNDPAELLEFVADRDNYDEAVKLGFIPPKEKTDGPDSQRSTEKHEESTPRGARARAAEKPAEKPESAGRATPEKD